MDNLDRYAELNRLNYVLKIIEAELGFGKDRLDNSRSELREALTSYWEHHSASLWDQAQQAEVVDRQRSLAKASWQRQDRLKKLADSPYFGRIDFLEEQREYSNGTEQVYIGIASLVDPKTGSYLIYDWRSPIAGMFYDFEPGPAHYQCPEGTIAGEITLKRQYRISAGHLEAYFDIDLQIDDEILQEILSKNTDTKMRTIVSSIQREQNRIIRDELHPFLLVEGPAGSGKTSIALHRAAYLLYLKRKSLTAKNILILSPNQIFSNYISGVLPELGEENVQQSTYDEYILYSANRFPAVIERREAQLEYLLTCHENGDQRARAAAISYKTGPGFALIINNYLSFLNDNLVRDCPTLVFRKKTIFTNEEWASLFYEDLAYLPPTDRLTQIRKRVWIKLRPVVKELRREKEEEIAASGEEVNEKTIKALARLAARRELEPLTAEVDRLTNLDPFMLYRRLFEDVKLWEQLNKETAIPDEWLLIRQFTLTALDSGYIPYEDAVPLIFFQGCLSGFPVKYDIRHLIIDEAQDYSLLQFAVLKELFPKSSWTVLGDPRQTLHPYLKPADRDTIAAGLGFEKPLSIRLTRSYRSTREIQQFSQALLPLAEEVGFVNRSGFLPRLHQRPTVAAIWPLMAEVIKEAQGKGYQTIAVICKTAAEANQVFENLKQFLELSLITPETSQIIKGVLVFPLYLAKGLEFDAVLVYNVNASSYNRESDRRLLYIACTRALHQLSLFSASTWSPFIKEIKQDFYQTT